jgi:hypothetical protein
MRGDRTLVGVVVVAILLRLATAAAFPMGAEFDLESYRLVGEAVLAGENVYQTLPGRYPYFPGWMAVEASGVLVAEYTGLPFWLVIRSPAVLADAAICVVVYRFLEQRVADAWLSPLQGALFHALNPVAIAVVGGHGMFDSLPMLALVLSIGLLKLDRIDGSALALGLGIVLKPYPMFMGLLLLGALRDTGTRIRYFVLAAAPTVLLSVPFLLADPATFLGATLGYRSGAFMSWLTPFLLLESLTTPPGAALPLPFPHVPAALLLTVTKFAFLAATVVVSVGYARNKHAKGVSLWSTSLLIFLLFYVLSAALAPQYTYWVMPLLPLAGVSTRFRLSLVLSSFGAIGFWYAKTYALSEITLAPTVLAVHGLFLLFLAVFWLVSAYGAVKLASRIWTMEESLADRIGVSHH